MNKLKENRKGEHIRFDEYQKDRETDQWMNSEFLEEAAAIERELENIPDSQQWEPSEEKFQELLTKAREKGLMNETDKSVGDIGDRENRIGKEKVKKIKSDHHAEKKKSNRKTKALLVKRRVIKWAVAAAAICIGVFGTTLTSEANRAYLMQQVNKMFGNDVNTKVNNTDIMESQRTEKTAGEEIQNELKIPVPRLFYLPENMQYQDCQVEKDALLGIMQYSYGEQMIYLLVVSNDDQASRLYQSDEGKEIETIQNQLIQELKCTLWEFEEEGDLQPTYALKWEYKNTYCELFGKLPREEMEKIGNKIMY